MLLPMCFKVSSWVLNFLKIFLVRVHSYSRTNWGGVVFGEIRCLCQLLHLMIHRKERQLCRMMLSFNFSFYLWPQHYLGPIIDKTLSEDEGKHSVYRTLNATAKYRLQDRWKLQDICLLIATMWDIAASCIAFLWQGGWRREGRWPDFRSPWCHGGRPNICMCFPRPFVQI